MSRVAAQHSDPAPRLLQHHEAELGVDGATFLDEPVSHELRRIEPPLAEFGWREVRERRRDRRDDTVGEPDANAGLEAARERLGDAAFAPPAKAAMGVRGTQIHLLA